MENRQHMNVYQRTGMQIRRVRMEKGLSQASLSGSLALCGRSHLVNIENGKATFSLDTLEEIANALGVELRDFFPG